MKRIKFILAAATLLLFGGCGTVLKTTIDRETKSMEQSYEIIAQGDYPADMALYNAKEATAQSFRSDIPAQKEAFEVLYERLTAERAPVYEGTMVVVTMGTQSTGGYGYEITAVEIYPDASALKLKKIAPAGLATTALTNPYLILSLPKSYGKTEIVIE
ncbi:MAG: hypothetical protein B6D59_08295 [Campylobacteraceae bacterium 4484_4]|nr:MAG: hypothetical protein B6D59_08295 [Campylobacteraceae bacterium 4484_4]